MYGTAWRVHEHGHWNEVLQLEEIPIPQPGPGEVLVATAAAGLNFADTLAIEGRYQIRPPLPFTPGIELAGRVQAVGASSGNLSIGTRVAASVPWGAFSTHVCVPKTACLEVPYTMSDADAAAFVVTYQTAWFALVHRGNLKPGETLLVNNAAGGVGTAALQLGLALGARVIASAGGSEKQRLCLELGADAAIDYESQPLDQTVRELTDGKGADVIYESVGGAVFEASTRCIALEGRLVVVGFASGTIPSIQANRIMLKNIAVTGLNWGTYRDNQSPLIDRAHSELCALHADGKIAPVIGTRYPFEDLVTAIDDLRGRRAQGKSLLLFKVA
ncbi:MAG: NADPH2:quinone reductase [Hyphomicrobiaceae bacterium]|jgi:NADPH2:quinone reductase